jgi:hypothetical protein
MRSVRGPIWPGGLPGARAQQQPITHGERNSSDAWIVNGFKDGDRVIV